MYTLGIMCYNGWRYETLRTLKCLPIKLPNRRLFVLMPKYSTNCAMFYDRVLYAGVYSRLNSLKFSTTLCFSIKPH